jgi:deoxyxylulose-5-phosphate synthase
MELPTIFVFTHDAMGDGEDGPTHQPVEQLISLRAIPGLVVLRPGDANEVVEAYRYVLQLRHQPAAIALSRQPLPTSGHPDREEVRLARVGEVNRADPAPVLLEQDARVLERSAHLALAQESAIQIGRLRLLDLGVGDQVVGEAGPTWPGSGPRQGRSTLRYPRMSIE